MIKKFSKYLSDYFIKIGIVERKNKSWCQYVIEKKAIRLIFGMATLIFSLYIKKTLEIALFLIIFCSIRKHIGGWHASSPWKCLTLSSVMLLLITVFLEPSVERLPPIITLILNAVLFADILRCSPLYPQPWMILLFWFAAKRIDSSLFDSAICDGASNWVLFRKIYAPIVRPYVLMTAFLSVAESWNLLEQPMTFLQSKEKYPLSMILMQLSTDNSELKNALCLLFVIPLIILFFRVVDNVTNGFHQ